MEEIMPLEDVESRIYLIRGERVMLDRDLAGLYGVTTKRLNEAVKRNRSRFPKEFMFQLSEQEKSELVANCDHLKSLKFSYQLPYVFNEHGVTMLASVLNSERAIQMSILIVKTFVRLKRFLLTHQELNERLSLLEERVGQHSTVINEIVGVIRELMNPVRTEAIGFYVSQQETGEREHGRA